MSERVPDWSSYTGLVRREVARRPAEVLVAEAEAAALRLMMRGVEPALPRLRREYIENLAHELVKAEVVKTAKAPTEEHEPPPHGDADLFDYDRACAALDPETLCRTCGAQSFRAWREAYCSSACRSEARGSIRSEPGKETMFTLPPFAVGLAVRWLEADCSLHGREGDIRYVARDGAAFVVHFAGDRYDSTIAADKWLTTVFPRDAALLPPLSGMTIQCQIARKKSPGRIEGTGVITKIENGTVYVDGGELVGFLEEAHWLKGVWPTGLRP